MPEITTADRYQAFILDGPARKAAEALYIMNETINTQRSDGPGTLDSSELMNWGFTNYQAQLSARFNLSSKEILRHLGMDAPAIQIVSTQADTYHAYKVFPVLHVISDIPNAAPEYLLEVPVAYNGDVQDVPHVKRVTSEDYMSGGMGSSTIIGWGGLVIPPVASLAPEATSLPVDFDPSVHGHISQPVVTPALKAVVA